MPIIKRKIQDTKNQPSKLGLAQAGEAIRFVHTPFDDAVSESAFWLVLPKDKSQREGTVRLISVADIQTIIERDDTWPVYRHPIEIEIDENCIR
ncbi:MAG TPA: hypothetical protein PJ997_02325 [Candidatus Paceibacterota bacterium]|nr:hypothetical protein [Candidatus Paceibacterota bacterium]HMP19150.1 hypothetical protein [Candidatus Paceibacterota bacterium]